MNLSKIISLIVTKIKYIILVAVIVALAAFGYTKLFVEEQYTSSAKFLVDMDVVQNKASELTFAQGALNSYMAIFNTKDFFDEATDVYNAEKGEIVFTSSQIKGMTSIKPSGNADDPTFYITVTSLDPQLSSDIAKSISNYAVTKIDSFEYLNSIRIIDKPETPVSPSSPNVMKNSVMGFMLGLILTVAFFFCKEFLDGRIKNVEDISNEYEIPILGVIPDSTMETSSKAKQGKKRLGADRKEEK